MFHLLTIAHLTFHEARRRKILLAAMLLGLAFLTLFGLGFHFIYANASAAEATRPTRLRMILNFATMAGLYAVNFLMIMTAVLMPVDTMAGEIRSGVIQTLVTKPVRRFEIVLGKWLGFWVVLFGYWALMTGGLLVLTKIIANFTPPGIIYGLPLMLLEGTLLLTLSIAGGTRLSTLTNGVMVFGFYGLAFIGGWMEQLGTLFGSATARYVGISASLIMPSEALWQLAAYHMQPPLMREVNLTPFSPASVPSNAMVVWAIGYILGTLLTALWLFRKQDL
ncbi:MAG TPA: ABC transporter permease [Acidobacteriota bacterium]|nr:ABC transporter permease [Acidobacteriota bacterium]HNC47176.1 ABC transporter permease [Acidobacteriota bacterium]HNG94009.1 ABC transporter permease [Acidobacteriota bacterium]